MYPLCSMEGAKGFWLDLLSFVEPCLTIASDTFLMKGWHIRCYTVIECGHTSSEFGPVPSFINSCHMHVGFCNSIVLSGLLTVSMIVHIGGRDMGCGFSSQYCLRDSSSECALLGQV